eukprot:Plantae.Rhodophyta-Hildenbrandia_rubra.ctg8962.p1 GENE.Plantae.Rhodophyta-Hildenbrandia_rubra.ctg8962~~Plantae.Rhodophyta-Hildenbrandia_rubra.ctg8962.p1  ORF type:complete len:447 (+),score=55.45 Plantae.Rhodophyta-Hildenbrandia_rubra.ctg8962:127-1467(+)
MAGQSTSLSKNIFSDDPSLLADVRRAAKFPYHSAAKVVWQVVAEPMRFWVADERDQVCRPYYLLLLEIYPRGKVIHYSIHSPAADPPLPIHYAKFIMKYMLDPGVGEERARPTMISFVDNDLRMALAPLTDVLNVEVKTLVIADGVDDFVRKLSKGLVDKGKATRGDAAERPGLLISEGITASMMKEFMGKCVELFRNAPWDAVDESLAVEVTFPKEATTIQNPLYATILGSTKKIQGLALMATLNALRAKFKSARGLEDANSDDTTQENRVLGVLVCAFCGKRTDRGKKDGALFVNRCGGCKRLLYCDRSCQKRDWGKRHRFECLQARDVDYVFKRDEWAWLRRELAILFVDPTTMPFDDLDAIRAHSMPFLEDQSPPLYPLAFVTKTDSGLYANKMTRPTSTELLLLSMTCDALIENGSRVLSKSPVRFSNGVILRVVEDLAKT